MNKGHFGKFYTIQRWIALCLSSHSYRQYTRQSGSVLRSASAKIYDLKTGQIENQKRVMLLQDEVIKSKCEQVVEFKAAVRTEFKSSSDVVKQKSQEDRSIR